MPEHYKADQLQEPVQIVRKTSASDGAGGYTETATTLPSPSTYHMAFVRPLRGSERVLNDQLRSQVEILVVMYAAVAPLPTDTLLLYGVSYNIRTIRPPGLSLFVEIEAESGVVL